MVNTLIKTEVNGLCHMMHCCSITPLCRQYQLDLAVSNVRSQSDCLLYSMLSGLHICVVCDYLLILQVFSHVV